MRLNTHMSLNNYCTEALRTAIEKGWHDKPREFGTYVALMHSELSEALEADRRNEGIDRVSEELADVCIRIFDWCGLMGIDFEAVVRTKMTVNKGRSFREAWRDYRIIDDGK
jgi:NTP pyrophosphatase (non-canonical NTP hydrolase)